MAEKLRLYYFDIPGGRGQPARLAFELGGIEFEDVRFPFSEWPSHRGSAPFHACPFLEVDGRAIAQSNAITRYAGKRAGLYPEDPFQALLCDEILEAVEDMWVKLGPTMRIQDPDELRKARQELAEGPYTEYLQQFASKLEAAGGEYFADGRLTVADFQMLIICSAIASGGFDHIPTDLVKRVAPTLAEHQKRILGLPGIKEHYAKYRG